MTALVMTLTTQNAVAAGEEAWISHAWQTDDGLPNNDVLCLTQHYDGSMYFATRGGMSRLDGMRLTDVSAAPQGSPGHAVTGVYVGIDGAFWYICNTGLVRRKEGEEDLLYPISDIRADTRLVAIFEDLQGGLWLGFEFGPIFRIANGKMERIAVQPGMSTGFASSLVMDTEGNIWGAGQRSLAVWKNNRFEKVMDIPGERPALCSARDGGLWLGIGDRLFFYTEGAGMAELGQLSKAPPGTRVSMLHEDRNGNLWFGTFGFGLHLWHRGEFLMISLSNQDVWWLREDREANLWVGTGGGGACRVRRRVLTMLDEPDAPVRQTARAFCEDNRGNVWVVVQTGELFVRRNRQWQHLIAQRDWPGKLATSITSGRNGDVWIATSEQSLVRWDGQQFTTLALPPQQGPTRIRAMMTARDGKLWFGRGDKVVHGLPGAWVTTPTGASNTEVQALAHDNAGRVWAATQNGGLYQMNNGGFEPRKFPELQTAGPIRAMLTSLDGSLWLGTARGGMARLKDGRIAVIDNTRGLASNAVSQLVLDGQGRIWGAGDKGIFVASLASLNAAADGRARRVVISSYGRQEGVPSIQANSGYQPNAVAMASGRLWFASRSGIVIADPSLPGTNLVPPPVSIEGLRVNGQEMSLETPVQLGPGVNSLRAELAAMSFVAPQSVTLWHRLSGVDQNWVEADATRMAAYGSLNPGDYVLHVRAANNDGIPSRRDAVLSFKVLPFFWQTLWFQVGVGGLFFTGTAVTAYRVSQMKARRQTEAFKREADIQRERTRIARDMHDQIGASLTQIALLAELSEYEQETGDVASENLKLLAQTSREAVDHLDEIVWAVNPRHDNLGSLLEYVGQKAVQMCAAAGIRCRLEIPDHVPHRPLNADFRHHLFLMVQEAQNNVVKHAGATEVTLRVQPDEQGLQVTISDDGKGFDYPVPEKKEGVSNGLQNLLVRAESLNGTCHISSRPGSGATLTFTLPWPKS